MVPNYHSILKLYTLKAVYVILPMLNSWFLANEQTVDTLETNFYKVSSNQYILNRDTNY